MENNKKYFECYGLDNLSKAVLRWMKAEYTINEKAGILTIDAKSAELLNDIAQGTDAETALDEVDTEQNFYQFARANTKAIEESLDNMADSCGEDNALQVIYHFNWNNANRYTARDFSPIYSIWEIAKAYFREEDTLHCELFETLATYAIEETAFALDGFELDAEEAAQKLANA